MSVKSLSIATLAVMFSKRKYRNARVVESPLMFLEGKRRSAYGGSDHGRDRPQPFIRALLHV
jgi:hypothetical protein